MAQKKTRRGGFLGSIINQAIVPFGLLAAQQTYRKKNGGKRTLKTKKSKKSRRSH
jgi:hypothetical protein